MRRVVSFRRAYAGESKNFMEMPLDDLVEEVAQGSLTVPAGKVFRLEELVEAHRLMEEGKAGGKMVVVL